MSLLKPFGPEFEYEEECYQYLRKRERKRFQFHNRSPQIEYRKELVIRINHLCLLYKLSLKVKYLSVYILDFFMDSHDICEDRLELTLVSSLLIAAKVDENDNKIPKISEMLCDANQYLKSEALEMESKILQFFNWVFLTPTAATYVDYFYVKCLPVSKINSNTRTTIETYLENSFETRFYRFYPSVIAASVIYCVRDRLGLSPFWPLSVQSVTKYSFNQIESCVYELRRYESMIEDIPSKRFRPSNGHYINVKTQNDSGIYDCDHF